MTVSRAIRDLPGVKPELRRRVTEYARSVGYTLDPTLSSAMGTFRQSRRVPYRETVAFLVNEHNAHYHNLLYAGASQMARNMNYRIERFDPWKQHLSGRQVSRMLRARGIRGVLIAPRADVTHPHYTMDWEYLSVVLIGSSMANHGLPRVQFDHYAGCKLVLRKLQHLGYRRIGMYLTRNLHERSNRQLQAAYFAWCEDGARKVHELIYQREISHNKEDFKRWLQQRRVDCLIGQSIEGVDELKELYGPDFAKTVGFASLSQFHHENIAGIEATETVTQNGREAMRLLDSHLRSNTMGLQEHPLTILIPPQWTPGMTAPPRHHAKPATANKA